MRQSIPPASSFHYVALVKHFMNKPHQKRLNVMRELWATTLSFYYIGWQGNNSVSLIWTDWKIFIYFFFGNFVVCTNARHRTVSFWISSQRIWVDKKNIQHRAKENLSGSDIMKVSECKLKMYSASLKWLWCGQYSHKNIVLIGS